MLVHILVHKYLEWYLAYVVAATGRESFSDLKISLPWTQITIQITRLFVVVFTHSNVVRLTKSTFGSLLQLYKGMNVIPEEIIYKGFTYAFDKVISKVCADPKCKFLTEIIHLCILKDVSDMTKIYLRYT